MFRRAGGWVALTLAVSSCGGAFQVDLAPPADCTGAPLLATLHLDAADERYLWAEDDATGAFIELRLKDDPSLSVREGPPTLLMSGQAVVGRDGDRLISGCRDFVSGAYFIGPDDINVRS